MKFNYKLELKNILNNVYEYKLFEIISKNKDLNNNIGSICDYKEIIQNTKIYFGSELYDFILNLLPKDKDGYLFRCEIANNHNYSFPKVYDYLGNPLKNSNSNKFAIQLWESHMNNFLLEDLEIMFNQNDFSSFVENQLEILKPKLKKDINKYNENSKIIIPFNSFDDLVLTVKNMLLDATLDISYAQSLVDLNKLRDEMSKFSATFHMYNEFDKLEDDLEYCINNFFKYDSNELLNFLVKEKRFKLKEGIGLIKG
ncbi:hypothetical protein [Romboutsia lituseburensis]|uniref:hypothetical protein n=1 Tax=Romboutsia lituseburensis TaxID=1537 RepID=UPI00215B6716|nr:hypothetical protein [Romboutsia lituseburensis]MCR8745057.1 hypothetical protein [Romboutsia lituseburensis]